MGATTARDRSEHAPAGRRSPLLLLHGVTHSARIWETVAPLLADEFDLVIPTAAGHRGGPPAHRNTTISQLVDDAERLLDTRGLNTVHVAGNSMGGFIAIELARRGRALSVCALSPAGFWTPGQPDYNRATRTIRHAHTRASRYATPAKLAMRSPTLRRLILRDAAEHAERLSTESALGIVADLVECTAAETLLMTSESIAPLDPLPCPITLAWSGQDRIFPPSINGLIARARLPGAHYLELKGVGHVPMIDEPQRCSDVIRATARGEPIAGQARR